MTEEQTADTLDLLLCNTSGEGQYTVAAVSAVAFINFYLCAQCRYDKQKQQYHQKFFHFFCLSRITDAVRQKKCRSDDRRFVCKMDSGNQLLVALSQTVGGHVLVALCDGFPHFHFTVPMYMVGRDLYGWSWTPFGDITGCHLLCPTLGRCLLTLPLHKIRSPGDTLALP